MTIPRRAYIDKQTPTERAIRHAIEMVESLGYSPPLVDARAALSKAFEHVADWTDGQGASVASMAAPDASQGLTDSGPLPDRETARRVMEELRAPVYADDPSSPVRVVPRTVKRNQSVIAALERMLEEAKTDNITGIGIAVVNAEGYSKTNFEGGENVATLIGCVARLNKRLLDYQEGL